MDKLHIYKILKSNNSGYSSGSYIDYDKTSNYSSIGTHATEHLSKKLGDIFKSTYHDFTSKAGKSKAAIRLLDTVDLDSESNNENVLSTPYSQIILISSLSSALNQSESSFISNYLFQAISISVILVGSTDDENDIAEVKTYIYNKLCGLGISPERIGSINQSTLGDISKHRSFKSWILNSIEKDPYQHKKAREAFSKDIESKNTILLSKLSNDMKISHVSNNEKEEIKMEFSKYFDSAIQRIQHDNPKLGKSDFINTLVNELSSWKSNHSIESTWVKMFNTLIPHGFDSLFDQFTKHAEFEKDREDLGQNKNLYKLIDNYIMKLKAVNFHLSKTLIKAIYLFPVLFIFALFILIPESKLLMIFTALITFAVAYYLLKKPDEIKMNIESLANLRRVTVNEIDSIVEQHNYIGSYKSSH